jgi:hypothetical protein
MQEVADEHGLEFQAGLYNGVRQTEKTTLVEDTKEEKFIRERLDRI